jgi:hypothetical protein
MLITYMLLAASCRPRHLPVIVALMVKLALRHGAVLSGLLGLAAALTPNVARADMGPSCHCSTPQQRGGRAALAGLIGAGGVAALLVERLRRTRRS